jgi:hypothetical protein
MFAIIEMAAKDWGIPPWEVEDAPIEYLWRWQVWTAAIQDRDRREAAKWQTK